MIFSSDSVKAAILKKRSTLLLGLLAVALLTSHLSGCVRITIKRIHEPRIEREPDYVVSKKFYLLGIFGEGHVNTRIACKGKEVEQMLTEHTPEDIKTAILTLGIVAPKTAKVWCAEE